MSQWLIHPAVTKLQAASLAIVGLAREGLSTYRFLRSIFPDKKLMLADQYELEKLNPIWKDIHDADQNLVWELGPQHLNHLNDFDYIFLAPGIRTDLSGIATALTRGTKLHSNTQLFFELCPCPIIGVTGTKGKSTTTSLIHHILHTAGKATELLGNIGIPPLSGLEKLTAESLAVVELSCHQLQHLPYSPQVAVIQNITAEHLDYYPSLEAYVKAKSSIASHQKTEDLVIFDSDFSKPREIANLGQARQLTFSLTNHTNGQSAWQEDGWLVWQGERIIAISEVTLVGHHNLLNVIPSIIIGKHYGLTNQQIANGIKTFVPLPHRLQLVAEHHGVKYYNDSLSTEPQATINALAAFEGKPIILFAGGYERHQDYHELAKVILETQVKVLILFPSTGQRLWENVQVIAAETQQPLPIVHFEETMANAMESARQHVEPGDIVLLSPAAASFNNFIDYRDRGEQFAKMARET